MSKFFRKKTSAVKLKVYLDTNIIFGYFLAKSKELKGKRVELPKIFRFLYENKDRFEFYISPLTKGEIIRRMRTELNIETNKVKKLWEEFVSVLSVKIIDVSRLNLEKTWKFVIDVVSQVPIKKRFTNLEHLSIAKQLNLYFLTGDKEILRKCKKFYPKILSYVEFRQVFKR